jgi:drug/metabolite transporter (DMT)-like permease
VTAASLALVLVAAVLHATWNLLAKRASEAGTVFVWLTAISMATMYAPIAVVVYAVTDPEIGRDQLTFMIGSGLIHLVYFTVLQRGYKVGDLSLVYPLARGTGPMLSTIAAIAFLGERPTPLAIAGAVAVCVGVFILGSTGRRAHAGRRAGPAVAFGVLTGCLIATYTITDKHAVATLAVPPLLLDFSQNLVRTSLLAPYALRRRAEIRSVWTNYRREVLVVAAFAPLAYILVLTALTVSPVSYVAPAREVSILVGTLFGVRLLKEGHLGIRLVGATAIVAGLVGLALG